MSQANIVEQTRMATKSVRRSISMTPEMRDLLAQIVAKRGREFNENDFIRDAIRQYLDEQADVVGSRRHFQKSLQARLDRMESTLIFQMHVLTYLLAAVLGDESGAAIEEAIVTARRDGEALLKQIAAVRDLKDGG
jgi:Arc/MetJ-type ribon-helix-helix transcriptional regulator